MKRCLVPPARCQAPSSLGQTRCRSARQMWRARCGGSSITDTQTHVSCPPVWRPKPGPDLPPPPRGLSDPRCPPAFHPPQRLPTPQVTLWSLLAALQPGPGGACEKWSVESLRCGVQGPPTNPDIIQSLQIREYCLEHTGCLVDWSISSDIYWYTSSSIYLLAYLYCYILVYL